MTELKWQWVYYPYLDAPTKQEESALKAGYIKVVSKDDADKVIDDKDKEIAELKKKLMPCLNGDCILTCEVVEKYGKENAELKAKLENVQASMYCDVVDANMENRRLKRALWLARAELAKCEKGFWVYRYNEDCGEFNYNIASRYLASDDWIRVWQEVERKCRAKAEEYK